MSSETHPDETWRGMLEGRIPFYRRYRQLLGIIPSRHRCKRCHAPFNGVGGAFMRLMAHGPFNRNPRFCNW